VSYGCFTDRARRPAETGSLTVLGSARPAWDDLIGFAEANGAKPDGFKFYGRNYGWALTYRKGGRTLLALYPDHGGFTALVVLGDDRLGVALGGSLSDATRAVIAAATPFKEGRWLFVRVTSAADAGDVKELLRAKLGRAGRRPPGAAGPSSHGGEP
jgi:hypothetical protein